MEITKKARVILEKMHEGKKLDIGDFSSELEIRMVLNYLKDSHLIDFVWNLHPNENGLKILSERITPLGIKFIEENPNVNVQVIRKEDIVLSHQDYVVMAGEPGSKFYEVFYKGKKIKDCRGVIRTKLKELNKMKKNNKEKAEVKEPKNSGDVGHVIKLWDRLTLEMNRVFLEHRLREQVRHLINNNIVPRIQDMEKRDEEYQNLPEVRSKLMVEEIRRNDEILNRNKNNLREQIQKGLYQKGMQQQIGSVWYDDLIEKMQEDAEEINIKLESQLAVINPQFAYQKDSRWIGIQIKFLKHNLEATQNNLGVIKQSVEEVKQDIAKQNEKIIGRRSQIIEELQNLGQDVSEFSANPPEDAK